MIPVCPVSESQHNKTGSQHVLDTKFNKVYDTSTERVIKTKIYVCYHTADQIPSDTRILANFDKLNTAFSSKNTAKINLVKNHAKVDSKYNFAIGSPNFRFELIETNGNKGIQKLYMESSGFDSLQESTKFVNNKLYGVDIGRPLSGYFTMTIVICPYNVVNSTVLLGVAWTGIPLATVDYRTIGDEDNRAPTDTRLVKPEGSNSGGTLLHEVGHSLGLYHTFYPGCGGSFASMSDIPNQDTANYDAVLVSATLDGNTIQIASKDNRAQYRASEVGKSADSCLPTSNYTSLATNAIYTSAHLPDLNEMVYNIMDYQTNDMSAIFSPEQVQKMLRIYVTSPFWNRCASSNKVLGDAMDSNTVPIIWITVMVCLWVIYVALTVWVVYKNKSQFTSQFTSQVTSQPWKSKAVTPKAKAT